MVCYQYMIYSFHCNIIFCGPDSDSIITNKVKINLYKFFCEQASGVFSKNIYMEPDNTITKGKGNEGREGGRERQKEKERRWEKEFRSIMEQTQEILFGTSFF